MSKFSPNVWSPYRGTALFPTGGGGRGCGRGRGRGRGPGRMDYRGVVFFSFCSFRSCVFFRSSVRSFVVMVIVKSMCVHHRVSERRRSMFWFWFFSWKVAKLMMGTYIPRRRIVFVRCHRYREYNMHRMNGEARWLFCVCFLSMGAKLMGIICVHVEDDRHVEGRAACMHSLLQGQT